MPSPSRAQANLFVVVAAILLSGVLLVVAAVFLTLPRPPILGGNEPIATPSQAPAPSPTPSATASLPPAADVAGEDIASLPRYPGSVRSDYEIAIDDQYRLVVTEYLAAADLDDVRSFYQGVIAAQGWERADIGFSSGEWSWALVEGPVLALIEIEEANGLIEIDLQISEPLATPTPAPTESPPPPPPPAPPGDDDDDD